MATAKTLSDQYFLEKDVKPVVEGVKEEETPAAAPVVADKVEETTPAPAEKETNAPEQSSDDAPPAALSESSTQEDAPAPAPAPAPATDAEEGSQSVEEENAGELEATDKPLEIKLETAPADYRFPTTNQTRHCFTRYIEYHRCVAVKGEGATECDKFAKYYRSLCPSEWIERWNEQRANGSFPGPL